MPGATTGWTSPLLELLFEEPDVGRCLVAPDGSVLRVNAEWLRSTGASLDEVLGADAASLFPETRDMALAMHARARAGHHVDVPLHAQRLQGRETWWEGAIDPVPMEGGTGLLITTREVPAAWRREVAASSGRIVRGAGERRRRGDGHLVRAIANNIHDQIVLLEAVRDPSGEIAGWRYVDANDAAVELLGTTREEVVGKPLAAVLGERAAIVAQRLGRVLATGERERYEATYGGRMLLVTLFRIDASTVASASIEVTSQRRAEEALRRANDRLRLVQDAARIGSWDWNVVTGELVWSDRCKALYGLPPDTAMTYDVFLAAVHPDDRPRIQEAVRSALEAGGRYEVEMRAVHPDGGVRWITSTGEAYLDAGGRAVRMSGMAFDVSERKRTETALRDAAETAERTQAALAHAGAMANLGAWWIDVVDERDVNASPLHWSDEVYRIFGYQPREVPVSNEFFFAHVHPDDRKRVSDAVASALAAGQQYVVEHRVVRRDGTERVVLEHGEARRDGNGRLVRIVGAVQDVTDRKRAEEELRRADQRKSEFLAILSHELRNPLAPIRNGAYLLERAAPGSHQAARAREAIRRQTEHLTRLVDDLLDVTRISRGKIALHRERIDLREIAWKTTDDLQSSLAQAGIALRLDPGAGRPVWIDADPTRVSQVLGNLLQNSIKFTPRGGTVAVSIATADGAAELRVRDTGVGMDPATVQQMFEPFAQGDHSLARSAGGLGLGLALVKGLVELHGGAVEAHSDGVGKGAEFLVRLPLAAAAAEDAAGGRAAAGGEARAILVVEDNVDAAQTLADILELDGHRVTIAHDGRSGIELARRLRPDVVLCDIGLPDLDGYAVARELRRDGALRETRLVALSGYAQPEDRERAREAGFDAHLAKPPDLDALKRVLAGR